MVHRTTVARARELWNACILAVLEERCEHCKHQMVVGSSKRVVHVCYVPDRPHPLLLRSILTPSSSHISPTTTPRSTGS